MKHASARDAVQYIESGHRVFVQGGVATPHVLLAALVEQAERLRNVELIHLHTTGPADYAKPEHAESFRVVNLFLGGNVRPYIGEANVAFLPCFLSEIPNLFRSERRKLDVSLIHVSPPDRHGYCSLGTSVDVVPAALDSSEIVIAQVNPRMPRVHGDGIIHISRIDHWTEVDAPIDAFAGPPLTAVHHAIARHVSALIDDGSTLQVGIGAVPDAVAAALTNHRHLGVHTEMWSDGILDLIQCGAVDNSRKAIHRGKTLSGFLMGSQRLYDFVDDNPSVIQKDIAYVNAPATIARNPKVVAINSAVEVDLTGQVCADSIGTRVISGIGGQMDFIRGASLSPGGKPIIALPSTTKSGESRIVPTLRLGAGVVTTRAHVHYVVTEHGVADLYGKTTRERSAALVELAAPEHRETLLRQWHEISRK